jgi:hypothetical protein
VRIVLLHGLSRTRRSMAYLARGLQRAAHQVVLVEYRSRLRSIRDLAGDLAERLAREGLQDGGPEVGFVCHSMGGLLLRALPLALPRFSCGRSVLIGCPLLGSLLAEKAAGSPLLASVLGPALRDLTPAGVRLLPPVPGPYGVIAGSTWSPLVPAAHLLRRYAPGEPSDSTVRVCETAAEDAADHLVLRGVHTLLPENREVRRQVLAFLAGGAFVRTESYRRFSGPVAAVLPFRR